jgi:hypothetical protein
MRLRPIPRRALRGVVLVGVGLSAGTALLFFGCSSDDGTAVDTTLDATARRPPDVIFDEDPPLQCNDLTLMGPRVPARAAGALADAGASHDGGADMEDAGAKDASADAEAEDASAADASAEASTVDASTDASAPSGDGGLASVEPPPLHGGTITDGVYVLSETIVYAGAVANFDAQRETVRIAGDTWNNVTEQRGYMTERSTFVFRTSGNELRLRNVCHDYPAYDGEFTLLYEATFDSLRIEVRLNGDVGHYVYRKQP